MARTPLLFTLFSALVSIALPACGGGGDPQCPTNSSWNSVSGECECWPGYEDDGNGRCRPADGDEESPDGDMPDGDTPDGDPVDGDQTDGDQADGDLPDGDPDPDGDTIVDPCANGCGRVAGTIHLRPGRPHDLTIELLPLPESPSGDCVSQQRRFPTASGSIDFSFDLWQPNCYSNLTLSIPGISLPLPLFGSIYSFDPDDLPASVWEDQDAWIGVPRAGFGSVSGRVRLGAAFQGVPTTVSAVADEGGLHPGIVFEDEPGLLWYFVPELGGGDYGVTVAQGGFSLAGPEGSVDPGGAAKDVTLDDVWFGTTRPGRGQITGTLHLPSDLYSAPMMVWADGPSDVVGWIYRAEAGLGDLRYGLFDLPDFGEYQVRFDLDLEYGARESQIRTATISAGQPTAGGIDFHYGLPRPGFRSVSGVLHIGPEFRNRQLEIGLSCPGSGSGADRRLLFDAAEMTSAAFSFWNMPLSSEGFGCNLTVRRQGGEADLVSREVDFAAGPDAAGVEVLIGSGFPGSVCGYLRPATLDIIEKHRVVAIEQQRPWIIDNLVPFDQLGTSRLIDPRPNDELAVVCIYGMPAGSWNIYLYLAENEQFFGFGPPPGGSRTSTRLDVCPQFCDKMNACGLVGQNGYYVDTANCLEFCRLDVEAQDLDCLMNEPCQTLFSNCYIPPGIPKLHMHGVHGMPFVFDGQNQAAYDTMVINDPDIDNGLFGTIAGTITWGPVAIFNGMYKILAFTEPQTADQISTARFQSLEASMIEFTRHVDTEVTYTLSNLPGVDFYLYLTVSVNCFPSIGMDTEKMVFPLFNPATDLLLAYPGNPVRPGHGGGAETIDFVLTLADQPACRW